LRVVYNAYASTTGINLRTKLEVFRFSQSKDMKEDPKNVKIGATWGD